jgi:hypothetical protein
MAFVIFAATSIALLATTATTTQAQTQKQKATQATYTLPFQMTDRMEVTVPVTRAAADQWLKDYMPTITGSSTATTTYTTQIYTKKVSRDKTTTSIIIAVFKQERELNSAPWGPPHFDVTATAATTKEITEGLAPTRHN